MIRVPTPEFSRPVDLTISRTVATMSIAADAGERTALARRMEVDAIDRLEADLTLEFLPGKDRLRLSGRIKAVVRQACIVTLEPVDAAIDESFAVVYVGTVADTAEVSIQSAGDPAGGDAWDEPWPGSALDVGEAVAQQLALAIDPYPCAAGAVADPAAGGTHTSASRPFAALSSMVKGRRGRA